VLQPHHLGFGKKNEAKVFYLNPPKYPPRKTLWDRKYQKKKMKLKNLCRQPKKGDRCGGAFGWEGGVVRPPPHPRTHACARATHPTRPRRRAPALPAHRHPPPATWPPVLCGHPPNAPTCYRPAKGRATHPPLPVTAATTSSGDSHPSGGLSGSRRKASTRFRQPRRASQRSATRAGLASYSGP
jgi:hypothetical protein